jgi:transposase
LASEGASGRGRNGPVAPPKQPPRISQDGLAHLAWGSGRSRSREGLNSRIQAIRVSARGYRNREHFKTAIYFHLGGLQLYPATP